MKTQHLSALVLTALVASLSAGCENAASTAPAKAQAVAACVEAPALAGDHVYVFSAGSVPWNDGGLAPHARSSAPHTPHARVERTIRGDGSETLSSVSRIAAFKVMEYAELGPDGRLVYADVSAVGANGEARRLIADAAHGVFYVQDEHGSSGWKRLSTDAPWVYAGLAGEPAFTTMPTPVSAWVTLRAASASADVRVLDATLREGRVVPRDQLVAEGAGDERFVIAGHDVLAANGEFVTSLGEASAEPLRLADVSLRPRRVASR